MVTITHHDGTQLTVYPSGIPDLWHLSHELYRTLQELQTNQEVKP